jgi:hypothetical protein
MTALPSSEQIGNKKLTLRVYAIQLCREAKASHIESGKEKWLANRFKKAMYQKPIQSRQGVVFKIRYRVRMGDGKWKQKSETLHDVGKRKPALNWANE